MKSYLIAWSPLLFTLNPAEDGQAKTLFVFPRRLPARPGGGGEPKIPGVSIGHNEYGVWGLTVFQTDGEDLYVYDTHADAPSHYRYRGHWEAMRVIQDTIRVKGQGPVVVDLKYTRHGPVWTSVQGR